MTPHGLTTDERERYEERAAIREYHGGQTRAEAEAGALEEILAARRRARKDGPRQGALFQP